MKLTLPSYICHYKHLLGGVQSRSLNSLRHTSTTSTKATCLLGFHKKCGAKLEPFAGYMMPILYKNQSIKSEHTHTRESASVFDVSHMMQTTIRGEDKIRFIESLTVADIEGINLGKCALSVFTNESGGIIDDCIISKHQGHLHIVSNAGNAKTLWHWLNKSLSGKLDVQLERLWDKGLIALQGPKSAAVLQSMTDTNLAEIEFMNSIHASIDGLGLCQITRCGYTGEDGFEISVDPTMAEDLMHRLTSHKDVRPAGFGARDTLRLEAGLCLHGHDITDRITPVEADLSWTVAKRRRLEQNFIGHEVILNQLRKGSSVKRVGLIATGGPLAREGTEVSDSHGNTIGVVTSGNYSPSLGKNISMAYIPTVMATEFNQAVWCKIRGKPYEYTITRLPFVKPNYYIRNLTRG